LRDLKKQTLSGLFWSSVERLSFQIVQFVLGIILARLLMPGDYGLIGMIAVFLSISNALIDGGFSQALIQKQDTSEEDYNTVFIFNLLLSITIYIILFFFAPAIAFFYETPALESLIKVIGLSFIISSFSIVHIAKLTKTLNFKLQTKVTLFAVIISGVIGIALAYLGYGVWSLVVQLILRNLLTVILLFLYSSWYPVLYFSKKSFNSLFSFGSKILASSLLNAVRLKLNITENVLLWQKS
jgi:O-antigen/teichoic acid export membrane protein